MFVQRPGSSVRPSGGRAWWAHFEFTRINIAPTILPKKIEDLREACALMSIASGTFQSAASRKVSEPWCLTGLIY
jgi:hypothetical protein